MTNDDMLTQAITALQAGQLDDAERHFKALLAQDATHLAGLNLLGVVLTAARKFDEAERVIRKAIAVNAGSDATHYNHGIVLKALGRPGDALAAFDKALAINPTVADSWGERGAALNELGRPEDALASSDRALQLDTNSPVAWYARGVACNVLKRPHEAADAFNRAIGLKRDYAEAWVGLAGVLSLARQSEDALTAYDTALALTPGLPDALLGRALSLAQMKRTEEAIAAYRDAARHGVDAELVRYHLAAMGAEPPPSSLPPQQVATVFDQYAETFDKHLTEVLRYDIPAAAAAMVKRHITGSGLDILDLGCGTGLAGAQFAALKKTMIGVDLSPKMLEKAKQRGVYDELVCGELIQFLDSHRKVYDAVIAADVFVYVGDLAPAFHGVARALKAGGLFCFSIEASADRDFVVRESFRFAHSAAYIERLAEQHGFTVEERQDVVVRQDGDTKIEGYLALLRRIR